MKITAIKQQIKNTDRVNIFLDGKYSFSLSLGQLLDEKLVAGQELEEQRINELKKQSLEGKLKAKALNWLLLRPHSKKEFRDYLARKKADPELIQSWQEEFSQKKYLDDEAFSDWWAQNRRSSKHSSSKKIRFELMQKGIESEIIDKTLTNSDDVQLAGLIQLIGKKQKIPRFKKDRQKLTEYLMRQGFPYSVILQAFNQLDEE